MITSHRGIQWAFLHKRRKTRGRRSEWTGEGRIRNTSAEELYDAAVANGEGVIAEGGPLVVTTGQHTGPLAQRQVRGPRTRQPARACWWDNNRPMAARQFATLRKDMLAHAKSRRLYVQDLFAGADAAHRLPVRIVCEYAWHALFIRHLLIRPEARLLQGFAPRLTIIDLPSFRADRRRHATASETVIACNFSAGVVLIGGTSYAGEMKKSVFSVSIICCRKEASCRCIAPPTRDARATRRCSSVFRAPARRRCRPIRTHAHRR